MRLIDADWLEEHQNLYTFNTRDDIRKFINDAPAADAELIRHGRWVEDEKICVKYRCSECGHVTYALFIDDGDNDYCCHCGAKMSFEKKGEKDETD